MIKIEHMAINRFLLSKKSNSNQNISEWEINRDAGSNVYVNNRWWCLIHRWYSVASLQIPHANDETAHWRLHFSWNKTYS